MDFEQVVFARRSIRAFTEQDVAPELIEKLIAYGNEAPSGGNLKAWRFVVVRDPKRKKAIVEATYQRNSEKNPPQRWIESAPVVIAVCCDLSVVMRRYGRHAIDNLAYLDCSAAIENMLLGCVHLGLGSTYISGFRPREMADALALPDMVEPVALLPIGYPKVSGVRREDAPISEITYYEQYGDKHCPKSAQAQV